MGDQFPANLLKELHFEEIYLTDEQEERLYEVLNASMPYERRAFDRHYVLGVPLAQIAKEEQRTADQVMIWIAKIATNVQGHKDYIMTGKYQDEKIGLGTINPQPYFLIYGQILLVSLQRIPDPVSLCLCRE